MSRQQLRIFTAFPFHLAIACWLAAWFLNGNATHGQQMKIGTNIEAVNDYATNWMFTDAFKASRAWVASEFNTVTEEFSFAGDSILQLDDSGWVTELASFTNNDGELIQQWATTLMMWEQQPGTYPAGIYRMEWSGNGTLANEDLYLQGDIVQIVSEGTTPQGRHFAEIEAAGDGGGFWLQLRNIDPADPLRDFNFWMPEYQGQNFFGQRNWTPQSDFSPFHPRFLESLQPLDSIRAMQIFGTLEFGPETAFPDHTIDWSDRRLLTDARQVQSDSMTVGVALEYMVALANELDKDLWVCVPHAATDNYITNMATYLRDNLEPELRLTVEWSNEVWNFAPGFPANPWIEMQLDPKLGGADRWSFVASRIRNTFTIFETVFVGQTDRLNRVVASFAAVPFITNEILLNMDGQFDSISIASYYAPDEVERGLITEASTVADVLSFARDNIATTMGYVQAHNEIAEQYGNRFGREIPVVMYEGGPHFNAGFGHPNPAVFTEAAHNEGIYELQRLLLNGLNDLGVDEHVSYQHTERLHDLPYGNFGSLTYIDQPIEQAHRYRSLLDVANGSLIDSNNVRPSLSTNGIVNVQAGQSFSLPVQVTDVETPNSELELIIDSEESFAMPNSNITISGTGGSRTVTVQTETSYVGPAGLSILLVDSEYGTDFQRVIVNISEGTDVLLGDVNRDGDVNLLDVMPFIAILSSMKYQVEADINEDGEVDLLDVLPFVTILTNG